MLPVHGDLPWVASEDSSLGKRNRLDARTKSLTKRHVLKKIYRFKSCFLGEHTILIIKFKKELIWQKQKKNLYSGKIWLYTASLNYSIDWWSHQISESSEPSQKRPRVVLTNDLDWVLDVCATTGPDHTERGHRHYDAAARIAVRYSVEMLLLLQRRGLVQLPLEDVDLSLVDSSQSGHFSLAFHPQHFFLLKFGLCT